MRKILHRHRNRQRYRVFTFPMPCSIQKRMGHKIRNPMVSLGTLDTITRKRLRILRKRRKFHKVMGRSITGLRNSGTCILANHSTGYVEKTKRTPNNSNLRRERRTWEIMVKKTLSSQPSGNNDTASPRIKRHHAHSNGKTSTRIRNRPSKSRRKSSTGYVVSSRTTERRLPMGRPLFIQRKMDKTTESNGFLQRLRKKSIVKRPLRHTRYNKLPSNSIKKTRNS